MFGLSSLELRLAFYGVLLAAIGSWLVYERHHLIGEGEARIKAQDASARASQKAEDEKTSAGVVNDLKTRLAAIPATPSPTVRLCPAPRSVRAVSTPSGTQPPLVADTGTGSGGVPSGTAGIEIGGALSDAQWAAQVLAIYRDETWGWAVKQAGR